MGAEQMEKIHIWIGNTNKNEEEYNGYFELDYSTEGDFDDPEYKICQFCKDTGNVWYDEDFIGILFYEEKKTITEILKDIPINEDEKNIFLSICENLQMSTANAAFYLTDADTTIAQPYKEYYNDLKFIGTFVSEFAS